MVRSITYDDLRSYMASRTQVRSSFGVQLERLRDNIAPGSLGNWRLAMEREEEERLRGARLLRCVDSLTARHNIRFAYAPDLKRFARRAHRGDGEVVVRVLQAYEPWGTHWPEKGLAEAYLWLRTADRRLRCLPTALGQEPAHLFRTGAAKEARRIAASVVADAHVCLYSWVRVWDTDGHAAQHTVTAA